MEQDRPALPGAIAPTVERPLSATTAKGNKEPKPAGHPMLPFGVFKATGHASPDTVAGKGAWMRADIPRWAARCARDPHFTLDTPTLMRGAVGMPMRQPGDFLRDAGASWRARRVQPRNLGDAAVKAKRVANTEASVARGGFGAATCVVGDALFFGQDRLDFVRESLTAA